MPLHFGVVCDAIIAVSRRGRKQADQAVGMWQGQGGDWTGHGMGPQTPQGGVTFTLHAGQAKEVGGASGEGGCLGAEL